MNPFPKTEPTQSGTIPETVWRTNGRKHFLHRSVLLRSELPPNDGYAVFGTNERAARNFLEWLGMEGRPEEISTLEAKQLARSAELQWVIIFNPELMEVGRIKVDE